MSYCSLSDLQSRYGEALLVALTDRGPVPTNTVDEAVVARAIGDAGAMIDGYLASRYVLPLGTVPPLLAGIAPALVLWNLHLTTPEGKIKADYDAAISLLRDIARGSVRLPDAAGIEPAGEATGGVQTVDRERPFTEENMRGWI